MTAQDFILGKQADASLIDLKTNPNKLIQNNKINLLRTLDQQINHNYSDIS